MRYWRALPIAFFICLTCATALAADFQPAPLPLKDYIARLDQLSAALQGSPDPKALAALAGQVPLTWKVEAQGRRFEVDNSWLLESLHQLSRRADPDLLRDLQDFVIARQTGAASFLQAPRDLTRSRRVLQSVLASREFRGDAGPGWYDRLRQKIWRLIFSALQRFFGSALAPIAGRILAWGIVALVFLMVGLWVYRTIRRGVRVESFFTGVAPVSARGWTAWLADARAQAEQGHWREAIHFAYWAGVSRLEEEGLWRPDRARTPREYLTLLPAASAHRPALNALTSQFELVWYAGRPAGAMEFSSVVSLLEQLGCR